MTLDAMKILIVDDEPPARSRLKSLVNDLQAGEVIAEASNGKMALEVCQRQQVDIVLLDIRMPGMDGIETANHLTKLDNAPAIVFTTAYDEYALQAFDAHAIDYLLKPIRKERLQQALEKAHKLSPAQNTAIEDANKNSPQYISARVQGGLKLIDIEDVIYFYAEHKYVTVFHKQGQVLIEDSLKSLEQKYTDRFIRIHRNALVATQQLQELQRSNNGHFSLLLKEIPQKLDVSRRHLPMVKKEIKKRSL